MLDSGAGISVTDIETLTSLDLDKNITTEEGYVRGFNNDVKQSTEYMCIIKIFRGGRGGGWGGGVAVKDA